MPAPITRLYATVGGPLGPSYSIELEDHDLHYTASLDGAVTKDEVIQVDDAAIVDAALALERAALRRWHERYADDSVCDGTHWLVEVGWASACPTRSSGSNAFPSNGRFEAVCHALSELAGARPFK